MEPTDWRALCESAGGPFNLGPQPEPVAVAKRLARSKDAALQALLYAATGGEAGSPSPEREEEGEEEAGTRRRKPWLEPPGLAPQLAVPPPDLAPLLPDTTSSETGRVNAGGRTGDDEEDEHSGGSDGDLVPPPPPPPRDKRPAKSARVKTLRSGGVAYRQWQARKGDVPRVVGAWEESGFSLAEARQYHALQLESIAEVRAVLDQDVVMRPAAAYVASCNGWDCAEDELAVARHQQQQQPAPDIRTETSSGVAFAPASGSGSASLSSSSVSSSSSSSSSPQSDVRAFWVDAARSSISTCVDCKLTIIKDNSRFGHLPNSSSRPDLDRKGFEIWKWRHASCALLRTQDEFALLASIDPNVNVRNTSKYVAVDHALRLRCEDRWGDLVLPKLHKHALTVKQWPLVPSSTGPVHACAACKKDCLTEAYAEVRYSRGWRSRGQEKTRWHGDPAATCVLCPDILVCANCLFSAAAEEYNTRHPEVAEAALREWQDTKGELEKIERCLASMPGAGLVAVFGRQHWTSLAAEANARRGDFISGARVLPAAFAPGDADDAFRWVDPATLLKRRRKHVWAVERAMVTWHREITPSELVCYATVLLLISHEASKRSRWSDHKGDRTLGSFWPDPGELPHKPWASPAGFLSFGRFFLIHQCVNAALGAPGRRFVPVATDSKLPGVRFRRKLFDQCERSWQLIVRTHELEGRAKAVGVSSTDAADSIVAQRYGIVPHLDRVQIPSFWGQLDRPTESSVFEYAALLPLVSRAAAIAGGLVQRYFPHTLSLSHELLFALQLRREIVATGGRENLPTHLDYESFVERYDASWKLSQSTRSHDMPAEPVAPGATVFLFWKKIVLEGRADEIVSARITMPKEIRRQIKEQGASSWSKVATKDRTAWKEFYATVCEQYQEDLDAHRAATRHAEGLDGTENNADDILGVDEFGDSPSNVIPPASSEGTTIAPTDKRAGAASRGGTRGAKRSASALKQPDPVPPAQAAPRGGAALVGSRVQVFWEAEQERFKGTVTEYRPELSPEEGGEYRVEYDDGDTQFEVFSSLEILPEEKPRRKRRRRS